MGVHLGGDGKDRGGVPDNEGVHAAMTEHDCTVHPYAITARPVWGVGEGTGGADEGVVVVAGRNQSSGGKGSEGYGSGGGGGRGEGVTEGTKSKTTGTEHQKRVQVANLTN